jgi:hypothetical protein
MHFECIFKGKPFAGPAKRAIKNIREVKTQLYRIVAVNDPDALRK